MKGTLYLVATPIGNLEDMTLRALRILKEVDIIAAEDTRHTLGLLNHFEISKPLISYHRHSKESKTEILIQKILDGNNIAIVSDAGTPGICDPGEAIIKEAIQNEIEVISIPGACAFVNALVVSGISSKEFAFYGFLPMNAKLRKEKLMQIRNERKTVILYEAPHKLHTTLQDIFETIGDISVVLARELTKIHEEKLRGKVSNFLQIEPKGEYVIVLDLNQDQEEAVDFTKMSLKEHYQFYETLGLPKKEIIKQIAKDRNVSKNEIYQEFLEK